MHYDYRRETRIRSYQVQLFDIHLTCSDVQIYCLLNTSHIVALTAYASMSPPMATHREAMDDCTLRGH